MYSAHSDENKKVLTFKDHRGFKYIKNIKKKYTLKQVLGAGNFGQVRLAYHQKAEIACAIKLMDRSTVEEREVLKKLLKNELSML